MEEDTTSSPPSLSMPARSIATPGSVASVWRVMTRSSAARATALGLDPRRRATRRGAGTRHGAAQLVGRDRPTSAWRLSASTRSGSGHGAVGIDADLQRPGRRRASGSAASRRPGRRAAARPRAGGPRRRARGATSGVEGGDRARHLSTTPRRRRPRAPATAGAPPGGAPRPPPRRCARHGHPRRSRRVRPTMAPASPARRSSVQAPTGAGAGGGQRLRSGRAARPRSRATARGTPGSGAPARAVRRARASRRRGPGHATRAHRPRPAAPGSQYQRTAVPYRSRWSIVWGAPTPCSSRRPVGGEDQERHEGLVRLDDRRVELRSGGARGAQHARRAVRPAWASPSAMNDALRSSWCTCTRTDRPTTRARAAIGVDREPGLDDRVGEPAACPLVDQGGAVGRGDVAARWRHRAPARSAARAGVGRWSGSMGRVSLRCGDGEHRSDDPGRRADRHWPATVRGTGTAVTAGPRVRAEPRLPRPARRGAHRAAAVCSVPMRRATAARTQHAARRPGDRAPSCWPATGGAGGLHRLLDGRPALPAHRAGPPRRRSGRWC